MSWIEETIASFGQAMGLPDLHLDNEGETHLTVDDDFELMIAQPADTDDANMLVSLLGPMGQDADAATARALTLADFRRARPFQAQVAIIDDRLSITVRIPKNSFVISLLEESVQELFYFHETATRSL